MTPEQTGQNDVITKKGLKLNEHNKSDRKKGRHQSIA